MNDRYGIAMSGQLVFVVHMTVCWQYTILTCSFPCVTTFCSHAPLSPILRDGIMMSWARLLATTATLLRWRQEW